MDKVYAALKLIRDLGVGEDFGMPTRLNICAISPEAITATPAAALVLGGLLLLIGP